MSGSPGKLRRGLAALAVGAAVLLLSGCIYLRLLALKRQLGDFDRNFTLQTHEGLRLKCLNPVLLAGDLRWLGIVPETTTKLGRFELWRVRWVKEVDARQTGPRPAAHDIELEINFAENKFVGFFMAERYFTFIPKSFFVGLLRGLGHASIDRNQRRVSADIVIPHSEFANDRPTIDSLVGLLGDPTERRTEDGNTLLRYRYLPPAPGSNNGDFDLRFTFNLQTGELLRLEGSSPVGKMALNFESTAEPKATGPDQIERHL